MASISDYLNIADAVYSRDVATWSTARWKIQKWETATWYGNGFQGGIFEDNKEVIVAFSGTMGGPLTAPISQNTANARIGIYVIPNMAGSGQALVRWAERLNKPISIVGHSLGGGLAQVIGAWSNHPFISFNGPGMARHLRASTYNFLKPRQMARSRHAVKADDAVGLCFNIRGDFVAEWGKTHVGRVVALERIPGNQNHDLDAIRLALADEVTRGPWTWHELWPAPHTNSAPPQLAPLNLGAPFRPW
jgi:hypothetical protein